MTLDELQNDPLRSRRFYTLDDLTHLPKPQWLIEGLMEVNSLVMLAGPPASYKSFMCLDWLLCMASGKEWLGKATTPSKVLYVLGEGKSSLLKRAQAWIHHNRPTPEQLARLKANFRTTFEVPQMTTRGSVDNMLSQLDVEDYKPNVIAIDTFARSFVGLDENSQKDTGLWVESAERLRGLGYTVIFLHHTKKNTEFGLQYRGSTAIMGAMDTAITMSVDKAKNQVTLVVSKQKDHDEGEPMRFSKLIIKPDPREEGSIVLVPAQQMDERFSKQVPKEDALMVQLIEDVSFESDRARARELARLIGIKESTANTRINRWKQDNGWAVSLVSLREDDETAGSA